MQRDFRSFFFKRNDRSFAIILTLLILASVTVVVTSSIFMAGIARSNAFENSVRSEAEQKQLTSIRAASSIASSSAMSALQGTNNDVSAQVQAYLTDNDQDALWGASRTGTRSGNIVNPNSSEVSFTDLSGNSVNFTTDLVNSLSASYSSVSYPNIRFGLKKPGESIIAKLFRYQLVTSLEQNLSILGKTSRILSSATTTKTNLLTIYEIPSQFAVDAGMVTVSQNVQGSVVASSAAINGDISGNVAVSTNVTWAAGSTVSGVSLGTKDSNVGWFEKLANTGGSGFTNQVSVLSDQSTVQFLTVGDRSLDAEGVSALFKKPSASDNLTVYSHPYFSCGIRVSGAGLDVNTPPAFTSLSIVSSNPTGTSSQRIAEAPIVGATWGTTSSIPHPFNPGLGNMLLVTLDVAAIPSIGGTKTIFIDLQASSGSARMSVGVALDNAGDPGVPFSIVSANPIFFVSNFNTANLPCSVLGSKVMNSLGASAPIAFTGSRVTTRRDSVLDPFAFTAGSGGSSLVSSVTLSDSSSLPPVTLKNWLVVLGGTE